jgi:uncharacterized Fe-S radical SAM superfamily protein PflX
MSQDTVLPEYLQKKSNYELWILSEKKREESQQQNLMQKQKSELPKKEIVSSNFIGVCSFCNEECNVLSQMCGQCMRELNHF